MKKTGMLWAQFCKAVAKLPNGTLWRHNVAGDLPGFRRKISMAEFRELIAANRGKRGFTYTHYEPQYGENAELIAEANKAGFTVNLSANSLEGADRLLALKIAPVVTLLPSSINGPAKLTTPQGARVVVCPATYKENVTCATCKLCAIASRKTVIGFPAHGTSKRKADLITSKGI